MDGDDYATFAKLAMAMGNRNGEPIPIGGPLDGIQETLKQMAKTGRDNPKDIYRNGVSLKQDVKDQLNAKYKFLTNSYQTGLKEKVIQAHQSGQGILSGLAGRKMLDQQSSKIMSYVRMLNNIPNENFSDNPMPKGQLFAQTMLNSYKELVTENKVKPEKANVGDVSKEINAEIDVELQTIFETQFEGTKNGAQDAVEMFKGLQGKPMNITEERFVKGMSEDLKTGFEKALEASKNQAVNPTQTGPGVSPANTSSSTSATSSTTSSSQTTQSDPTIQPASSSGGMKR